MGLGEIFVTLFVMLVFGIGIYLGIRLFKWNQKDRAEMEERNNQL